MHSQPQPQPHRGRIGRELLTAAARLALALAGALPVILPAVGAFITLYATLGSHVTLALVAGMYLGARLARSWPTLAAGPSSIERAPARTQGGR